jgi:hypothetical protein
MGSKHQTQPTGPVADEERDGVRIFVRRGALRRYDALKRKSEGLPVTVLWDRRLGERRAEPAAPEGNRRRADRRQEPPFTWTAADFVLTEHE